MKIFCSIIILFVITACSCSNPEAKEHHSKKHSGVYLDHGGWKGSFYTDKKGNRFLYRSVSTTITNDSTLSMDVNLNLLVTYHWPASNNSNNKMLKLFVLPKNITEDKQFASGISQELKLFLDTQLENSTSFHETIKPNEEVTVTIGILNYNENINATQMALISNLHKPHFMCYDSLMTQSALKSKSLALSIALACCDTKTENIFNSFLLIPCGQISFQK